MELNKIMDNELVQLNFSRHLGADIIECTAETWNRSIYKLPKKAINRYKDDNRFKQSGIYFLLAPDLVQLSPDHIKNGLYKLSIMPSIYIGQAIYRADTNQGILYRINEKHPNRKNWENDWTDALLLISNVQQEPIEKNELDYLENRFWEEATKCGKYNVLNINKPSCSPVSKEHQNFFDVDFWLARYILNILCNNIFIQDQKQENTRKEQLEREWYF